MKTPLAWHNLAHGGLRTAVAAAGVAFAVVLVFMQLGFLGAVEKTGTIIYESLDFDVLVRSPDYLHLADPATLPRARLAQAASLPGVRDVVPLHSALNQWRNPQTGESHGLLVLGIRPERPPFLLAEIQSKAVNLTPSRSALIDRKTRADYGPRDGRQFSDIDIGVLTEVGRQQIRIAGHFELGTGLVANGAILVNEEEFRRLFPGRSADRVSLGLVRVDDPASAAGVTEQLRRELPNDVEVLTRAETMDYELRRWIDDTSIGLIFQLGVAVSLIVGVTIVYQVLSSDIADHMPEYATLKAIGYGNGYLSRVVLSQAVLLAILGFIPGLAISLGLYALTSQLANMLIAMNLGRAAAVLGLTVAMCVASGLVAMRKVRTADPAELF